MGRYKGLTATYLPTPGGNNQRSSSWHRIEHAVRAAAAAAHRTMVKLNRILLLAVPFLIVAWIQWTGVMAQMGSTGRVRSLDARRTLLETQRLAKQRAAQLAVQPQPPKPVEPPVEASKSEARSEAAAHT